MPDSLSGLAGPIRDLRTRFQELTDPHRPALWQYCLRLTGSPWDAEDLSQETLLKAFARLSHLWQPIDNVRAWLFRVATNTWIDQVRRRRETLPLEDIEQLPADQPADAQARASEAMARLVHLLPPRQRVVVLLMDVFDFTAGETAAMVGATEGAVRALLHRARTTLARARDEVRPSQPSAPVPPVLARFVDAFNRRDPDAIVALLDEHATAEIVGMAEELGREAIRDQSLGETFASAHRERAELGRLDGVPVVLVYGQQADGAEALTWIIRLEVVGERICTMRTYYYTPEWIRHAGGLLGTAAAPAGYHYTPPPVA